MKQARILSMVTDTFGGYGGIALFNMHCVGALAAHPRCSEVVTVPLIKSGEIGDIPAKVTHVTSAIGGKLHYFASVMRIAMTYGRFDLITCGHIHLLPVAYLAHLVTR